MATLSATRRNSSTNSTSNSPRSSLSGTLTTRMSSLNEEDTTNPTNPLSVDQPEYSTYVDTSDLCDTNTNNDNESSSLSISKKIRNRAFSERSDSGISDCSVQQTNSNNCTPLLSKKLTITEEPEFSCQKTKRNDSVHENKSLNNDNKATSHKYLTNLNKNNKSSNVKDVNYSSLTRRGKVKEKIELFKSNSDGIEKQELKQMGLEFKQRNNNNAPKDQLINSPNLKPVNRLNNQKLNDNNKLNNLNKKIDLEKPQGRLFD